MSKFFSPHLGGWWQYDARTNDEIEMAFLHKKNYLEVQLCGSVYGIDLNENVQYCKDTPNRKRDIKRDSKNLSVFSKGVAGLLNTQI